MARLGGGPPAGAGLRQGAVTDEYGNVVGIMWGARGKDRATTVLLSSHMDTAEAGPAAAWQDSPFKRRDVRDDVLHGLGASDCKAGLAAQIYAGALLKRSLLPLRGNLVVAATVSEERGGSPGTAAPAARHACRRWTSSRSTPILGEPTALSVYYGHDGSATFEVLIEGPGQFSGHTTPRTRCSRTSRAGLHAARSRRSSNVRAWPRPRFQQSPVPRAV